MVDAWRIVDAEINRAAEGLRVLEESARFLSQGMALAERAKLLRHQLRAALPARALAARDVAGDVGTTIRAVDEHQRSNLCAVLRANAARVQEALRASEEYGKLLQLDAFVASCSAVRYASYDLERDLVASLVSNRLWRERLYVLVDPDLCANPAATAAAAVRGGAGLVQLRAKHLSPRAYAQLAAQVQAAVRAAGGLFIVNDHVAVAAALGSDGIHVGQEDQVPAQVRAVVGPLCCIGVSCHSVEQVLAAQNEPVDYLGLGPMYATSTKPSEPVRGPALLDAVAGQLSLPSFAIGGLDMARIKALRPRLPHGVALSGFICRAENPEVVARECSALLV